MSDEEMRGHSLAWLWLAELGGTVPEADAAGRPTRRRRPAERLADERPGSSAPEPTRRNRRG
jgi:hypothetical protein